MISKKQYICGGIILLLCLACILPVLALELNPLSYINRKPTTQPTVERVLVNNVSPVPTLGTTAIPRVNSSIVQQMPVQKTVVDPKIDDRPPVAIGRIEVLQYQVSSTNQTCEAFLGSDYNSVRLSSDDQLICNMIIAAYIKGDNVYVRGNNLELQSPGDMQKMQVNFIQVNPPGYQ
jgi:hypothetical protein